MLTLFSFLTFVLYDVYCNLYYKMLKQHIPSQVGFSRFNLKDKCRASTQRAELHPGNLLFLKIVCLPSVFVSVYCIMYFLDLRDRLSCSPGWPQTLNLVKDDIQFLMFLPPPKCWDYRNMPNTWDSLFPHQFFLKPSCSQGGRMMGLSKVPSPVFSVYTGSCW